jgi:hypothetical protein
MRAVAMVFVPICSFLYLCAVLPMMRKAARVVASQFLTPDYRFARVFAKEYRFDDVAGDPIR